MRFLIFFILFSKLSLGKPLHHVPLSIKEIGPNLPEVGNSLFDKIFSKNGQYEIPNDFMKILEKIDQEVGNGNITMPAINYQYLNFSRSLQGPLQRADYNPFLNPRVIVAVNENTKLQFRGKLFLGFNPHFNNVEVISFNEKAGRFEFQVIHDLKTRPIVKYADRSLCLSCHQNQGPLFTEESWNDMFLVPDSISIDHHKKANIDLEKSFNPGINQFARSNPELFENAVIMANDLILTQRLWVHGCKEDINCKIKLLVNDVVKNDFTRTLQVKNVDLKTSAIGEEYHLSSLIKNPPSIRSGDLYNYENWQKPSSKNSDYSNIEYFKLSFQNLTSMSDLSYSNMPHNIRLGELIKDREEVFSTSYLIESERPKIFPWGVKENTMTKENLQEIVNALESDPEVIEKLSKNSSLKIQDFKKFIEPFRNFLPELSDDKLIVEDYSEIEEFSSENVPDGLKEMNICCLNCHMVDHENPYMEFMKGPSQKETLIKLEENKEVILKTLKEKSLIMPPKKALNHLHPMCESDETLGKIINFLENL